MRKTAPFTITLSCTYSPGPMETWFAFVGFRPTRRGFTVWFSGCACGELTRHRLKLGGRNEKLSWRTACEFLYGEEQGAIRGDLRRYVEVSGEAGWKAELLAACWEHEGDEVPDEVKGFLIGLPDDELEWLVALLKGGLFAKRSVELLKQYVECENRPPRAFWAAIGKSAPAPSLAEIVRCVEQLADEQENAPWR